jgi:hypothetical protein
MVRRIQGKGGDGLGHGGDRSWVVEETDHHWRGRGIMDRKEQIMGRQGGGP